MQTKIWKFPLVIADRQIVKMPVASQILSAQMQGDTLCLWALVDPAAPVADRLIEILGTGNPAPEEYRRYISTVQMGPLVWHVFELSAE